jgi:hypothetical protein
MCESSEAARLVSDGFTKLKLWLDTPASENIITTLDHPQQQRLLCLPPS